MATTKEQYINEIVEDAIEACTEVTLDNHYGAYSEVHVENAKRAEVKLKCLLACIPDEILDAFRQANES